MALDLKIKLQQASDCKTFKLFDNTGDYNVSSNPGGYGSPNPAKTSFNGSQDYFKYIITGPDGIVSTIGPYAGNLGTGFSNSLLFTTGLTIGKSINGGVSNLTNLQSGKVLEDGNWIITYVLYESTGEITYKTSKQYFFTCNMDCVLDKELLKLAEDACIDKCDEKRVTQFMEYQMYYQALCASVKCGDILGAKSLYKLLAKKLNIDCGCNCK